VPCRLTGGDSTGFSRNSPKNRGERSDGAVATQAGVEPKSTAVSLDPGEQFDETEKANRFQWHVKFHIVWLTNMPSNRSPAALQQSGGEFSFWRIVSSRMFDWRQVGCQVAASKSAADNIPILAQSKRILLLHWLVPSGSLFS
jgi:hypothetical protein